MTSRLSICFSKKTHSLRWGQRQRSTSIGECLGQELGSLKKTIGSVGNMFSGQDWGSFKGWYLGRSELSRWNWKATFWRHESRWDLPERVIERQWAKTRRELRGKGWSPSSLKGSAEGKEPRKNLRMTTGRGELEECGFMEAKHQMCVSRTHLMLQKLNRETDWILCQDEGPWRSGQSIHGGPTTGRNQIAADWNVMHWDHGVNVINIGTASLKSQPSQLWDQGMVHT